MHTFRLTDRAGGAGPAWCALTFVALTGFWAAPSIRTWIWETGVFGYKERPQNKNPCCFNDKLSIINIHISATAPANKSWSENAHSGSDFDPLETWALYPRSKLLHVQGSSHSFTSETSSSAPKDAQKSPSLPLSLPAQADYTTRKSSFMLSWPGQCTVTSLWLPAILLLRGGTRWEWREGEWERGQSRHLLYRWVKDEWAPNKSKINDSLEE